MPETRDPFEYVSWCAGPSVDVSPLTDFPLCTQVSYTEPTMALFQVDMTIPDIAPPPLCPCIWTHDTKPPGTTDIAFKPEVEPTASIQVWPSGGENQNCCEPTYNIDFKLELPCIAFSVTTDGESEGIGEFNFGGGVEPGECLLVFSYHLSIPCIAFSGNAVGSNAGIGQFTADLVVLSESCELKLSYYLSIPCIAFSGNVVGTNTGIGQFNVDLVPISADCELKLSYYLSIPCIGFEIGSLHNSINIGNFDANIAIDSGECELKLSADISLPETTETVIVSIDLDSTNGFRVYKKELRVYEEVNDIGWVSIIAVGSCT